MPDVSPQSSHGARLAVAALSGLIAASCQSQSPHTGSTSAGPPATSPAIPPASASASAAAAASASATAPASAPAGKLAWSVQTQGKQTSIVDVQEGRVYALAGAYVEFGSPTRWVMSLEAESGRVLWSRDMGETIFSESFLSEGTLVLGSVDGKRTVLDAKSGATIAKKPPKDAPKGAPAELECKQDGDKLACRDAKGSAEKWKIPVAEKIAKITSWPGKLCFARSGVLTVECRKSEDGTMLWTHTVARVPNVKEPDVVHFDYRVDGDVLYVANYDGTIAAIRMGK